MPLIKWLIKVVNVAPKSTNHPPKIKGTTEGRDYDNRRRRNQNQKSAKKHIHQIRKVFHSPASYIHRGASGVLVSVWCQYNCRGTTGLGKTIKHSLSNFFAVLGETLVTEGISPSG